MRAGESKALLMAGVRTQGLRRARIVRRAQDQKSDLATLDARSPLIAWKPKTNAGHCSDFTKWMQVSSIATDVQAGTQLGEPKYRRLSAAERDQIATVLLNVLSGRFAGGAPLFAAGVDDRGELRAAALRTPPWPLLATDIDPSDADNLLSTWLLEDPEPPGVTGQPVTARAIAAAWAAKTWGRTRCNMREVMHMLEEVSNPPRPARGTLRAADPERATDAR